MKNKPSFLITPVADDEEASAEDTIRSLLDQGWYVLGDKTCGLKLLDAGDRICFYRTRAGVVAEATIAGRPEKRQIKFARYQALLSWAIPVKDVRYFFNKPIVFDAKLRRRLHVFRGHSPDHRWAWFVLTTRIVSAKDFAILVGKA